MVFVGSSLLGLGAAVAAGFGVMALPRSRADMPGIAVWENAPLPKLPDIFCGIYVRGGADVEEREQIADAIAAALQPAIRDRQLRAAASGDLGGLISRSSLRLREARALRPAGRCALRGSPSAST